MATEPGEGQLGTTARTELLTVVVTELYGELYAQGHGPKYAQVVGNRAVAFSSGGSRELIRAGGLTYDLDWVGARGMPRKAGDRLRISALSTAGFEPTELRAIGEWVEEAGAPSEKMSDPAMAIHDANLFATTLPIAMVLEDLTAPFTDTNDLRQWASSFADNGPGLRFYTEKAKRYQTWIDRQAGLGRAIVDSLDDSEVRGVAAEGFGQL